MQNVGLITMHFSYIQGVGPQVLADLVDLQFFAFDVSAFYSTLVVGVNGRVGLKHDSS